MRDCTLITAGCTTGWRDWIHSELWLCGDGLLLKKLDLASTKSHRYGPTVQNPPAVRELADGQISEVVAAHDRNAWIAAVDISSADFRLGRKVDRLSIDVNDGSSHKLLWLPSDQADKPLREALATWEVRTTQS